MIDVAASIGTIPYRLCFHLVIPFFSRFNSSFSLLPHHVVMKLPKDVKVVTADIQEPSANSRLRQKRGTTVRLVLSAHDGHAIDLSASKWSSADFKCLFLIECKCATIVCLFHLFVRCCMRASVNV